MVRGIDAKREKYAGVAKEIWGFAEIGYQEQKSSALLQQQLKAAGFQVTAGVAGIPTAFVATFGSGKPVIGIVGEFDALPGLSQEAQTANHHAIEEGAPGHGCGHQPARHRSAGGGGRREGVARGDRVMQERCGTTERRRKRAAPARCTWCATGSSRMWTSPCRGIRAIAMTRVRPAPPRTSPASSAFTAWRRTRRRRPIAAVPRSTPWRAWTTWST